MPDGVSLLKVDLASVYPLGKPIPYHGTERFAHPDILKQIIASKSGSSSGSSSAASPVSLPITIAPAFCHSLHSLTATCLYWRGLTAARRLALKSAGRDSTQLLEAWAKIEGEDVFVHQAFQLAHNDRYKELEMHLHQMIVPESNESRSS